MAGLAVLICVPFLLYFTARCFVHLSARQWHALAALGIVALDGASFALGWVFFIGAFVAVGHNSQPLLGAQVSVVGVLLLLVGVYALLGYGLRRLVRTYAFSETALGKRGSSSENSREHGIEY